MEGHTTDPAAKLLRRIEDFREAVTATAARRDRATSDRERAEAEADLFSLEQAMDAAEARMKETVRDWWRVNLDAAYRRDDADR